MGCNKLVLEIDGKSMLRHVAEAAIASRAHPITVVVGSESAIVVRALEGIDVAIVDNPDFRTGMSSSISAGIAALPDTSEAALILLADMAAISAPLIDRMVAAFDAADSRAICVATYNGRIGHPVLFARRYFPDLLRLEGDVGARAVVAMHGAFVCEVEAEDEAPLIDIDTPEALAGFRARKS
jgi:molybdenum cofactor cytidylyltransferase